MARRRAKLSRSAPGSDKNIVYRPLLCDAEPPQGFIAASNSQAIMMYCQPLLDRLKSEDDFPDDVLQIGVGIWNHGIKPSTSGKKRLIDGLKLHLKVADDEAAALFAEMQQRMEHLIPKGIQPDYPLIMFVRKEGHYNIVRFPYESLKLGERAIAPDEEDIGLIEGIRRLDGYISGDKVYSTWERMFMKLQEVNQERYLHWLTFKGLNEQSGSFSRCPDIWLDFIYRYGHDRLTLLNAFTTEDMHEFLLDFLPRKMYVKPDEYPEWPPALKLYYLFLAELRYINDPGLFHQIIDIVEPEFITFLKGRYE